MSNALKITDAEFEVMSPLWDEGPLTGAETVRRLEGKTEWKTSTVLTLLRRLVDKGVLATSDSERGILFTPLVTKEECIEAVGASFTARFFGGALMPMLAHFTAGGKLTAAEREELRRLLDEGEGRSPSSLHPRHKPPCSRSCCSSRTAFSFGTFPQAGAT
jgi:BlaI family penicillinase repressor